MELVAFVEDQMGVEVEDQEIVPDNFDSVSRLAAYVRRKSG
jgi:acyl carrier protein